MFRIVGFTHAHITLTSPPPRICFTHAATAAAATTAAAAAATTTTTTTTAAAATAGQAATASAAWVSARPGRFSLACLAGTPLQECGQYGEEEVEARRGGEVVVGG